MFQKPTSIRVRLATEDDQHLPSYDNTKLTAINTCPVWGIVRYAKHKTFPTNSRAMALEAGGAMHEVFAALRLYQLIYHTLPALGVEQSIIDQSLTFNGHRLFGEDKFEGALRPALETEEDERTRKLNFCLAALYAAGFYDDPADRRRTLSNLEEAAILYIERFDLDRKQIWVRDPFDPQSDVGIEIAFDLVIEFEFEDGIVRSYRFVGKFDGLEVKDGEIMVGENKTASRLDEAWRMSFELASQVTGYMLAASVWTQQNVRKAYVYGVQIPQPRSSDIGGLSNEFVTRQDYHFARWFGWFLHTVDIAERYGDDPVNAPRYTHSCNRYFRPCNFIAFCASDEEDQRLILEQEMVVDEWSPLHSVEGKALD